MFCNQQNVKDVHRAWIQNIPSHSHMTCSSS